MKKKRKLKKKVVVLLVLIVILLLLLGGGFAYYKFGSSKPSPSKPKIVNEIPYYGYVLEDNKTKLYNDLFKDLIKVLKEENVDYDHYAKLVSELAVSDFYTLDNKTSKNDIGGVQFIKEDNKSNFILQASETVYKYVIQNLDNTRKQELPEVSKIEVKSLDKAPYKYENIVDNNAYIVKLNLEYKKDLGYPKSVEVRLLHSDKKLEIYYMK